MEKPGEIPQIGGGHSVQSTEIEVRLASPGTTNRLVWFEWAAPKGERYEMTSESKPE